MRASRRRAQTLGLAARRVERPRSAEALASSAASPRSTCGSASPVRAASSARVVGPEHVEVAAQRLGDRGVVVALGEPAPRAPPAASARGPNARAGERAPGTAPRRSSARTRAAPPASRRARRARRARARRARPASSARPQHHERQQRVVQLLGVARRERAPPRARARSRRVEPRRDRAPSTGRPRRRLTARVRRSSSGASSRKV